MTTTDTSDIFEKKKSVLITNVVADGRPADIFIDAAETITDIGHDVRKRHRGEAEFIIDADGALALPGLANTHTHAAMTLLRGYADDMILQDWLSQKIWPLEAHLTGADVYWGTKLACLEMIRTGTTAFNDMYSLWRTRHGRSTRPASVPCSPMVSSIWGMRRNGSTSAGQQKRWSPISKR